MINNKQEATVQKWKEALENFNQIPITGGSGTSQSTTSNIYVGDYNGLYNQWYRPYSPCPGCGRCPVCGHGGGHFGPY